MFAQRFPSENATMLCSTSLWLSVTTLLQITYAYAEFGTVTAPCNFEPVFTITRPKFVPEDAYMRYEPYSSFIAAIAPAIRQGSNGTHETSWSLHFIEPPTRTTQDRGLLRRGVFSGDPPLATCRQCDKNGNPIDSSSNNTATNGVPSCSVVNYDVSQRAISRQCSILTASPGCLQRRRVSNIKSARLLLRCWLYWRFDSNPHSD